MRPRSSARTRRDALLEPRFRDQPRAPLPSQVAPEPLGLDAQAVLQLWQEHHVDQRPQQLPWPTPGRFVIHIIHRFSKDVYDRSIFNVAAAGSREETVMSRWNFGELTKCVVFPLEPLIRPRDVLYAIRATRAANQGLSSATLISDIECLVACQVLAETQI